MFSEPSLVAERIESDTATYDFRHSLAFEQRMRRLALERREWNRAWGKRMRNALNNSPVHWFPEL